MKLQALKPFVPAGSDFAVSRAFFVDLGFVVDFDAPGLTQLRFGGVSFLLQDFHNQVVQENFMIAVDVDDLDAFWEHLQASGVLTKYPTTKATAPTLFPWGRREVHLIDPAGVCWHFA